ncbi:uncharacterized protein F4812DRAFT_433721 [Daldinia caldariorum]|uniref:uncharacterized protein n=1 Tax=Daldinia caldariorum TaxID=326644 RepID=UPI0020085921|nr:uncharacterized protein F4812DRAFT_433721 [Daldinia caldariorum]KAI1466329.1 hypothetical protein F4812DRAFT_433721 [Daldinia caldariorum]
MTQKTSRKRSANTAYDDSERSKCPKILKDGSQKEVSPLLPWEQDKSLEQPPSPDILGLEFRRLSLTPIEALGILGRLPAEVRDEILRYMLLSPNDIPVFRGWTRVFERIGPKLDLSILYTCRLLWLEGLRILYGENTFLYDIRDPPDYLGIMDELKGRVYTKDRIPIDKYGHLMRYLKINAPYNRLNSFVVDNFRNAIQKFVPGNGLAEPARIHTLTLKLPAVKVKKMGIKGWIENPNEVPATKLFDRFSNTRELLMLLNVQYIRILATDSDANLYEKLIDLRCYYMQKQAQEDKDRILVKDAKGAEAYFQEQVERAKTQIYMLKFTVEILAASCPQERDYVQSIGWKFIGVERKKRYVESMYMDGALPDDFSGPPTPTSSQGSESPSIRPMFTEEQLDRAIAGSDDSETSSDSESSDH